MTDTTIRRALEISTAALIAALGYAGVQTIAPMVDVSHENIVLLAALATSIPMIGVMLAAWTAAQR